MTKQTVQIIIILVVLLVVIPLIITGLMYFKAQRDVEAKRKIAAAKTGMPPAMSAKDQKDWDDLFNNYEGITI